jgi:hypothetical protein
VVFTINMATAAMRNLDAALKLEAEHKELVAGYLFGIAAECAVKAMLVDLRLPAQKEKKNDPNFAHFPELRTMLRDQMSGRRSGPLTKIVQDDRFLQGWSIKIRYSDGKNLNTAHMKSWSTQARNVVGLMGT